MRDIGIAGTHPTGVYHLIVDPSRVEVSFRRNARIGTKHSHGVGKCARIIIPVEGLHGVVDVTLIEVGGHGVGVRASTQVALVGAGETMLE